MEYMEQYTRNVVDSWIKTINAPFTTDEVMNEIKRNQGKTMVEEMLKKRGLVSITLGNNNYVTDNIDNIVEKYGKTHTIFNYNPKNGTYFYLPIIKERLQLPHISVYLVEEKASEVLPIHYTLDDCKEEYVCNYEEFVDRFGNGEFYFIDVDNRAANHSWVTYNAIKIDTILHDLFIHNFHLKVVSKKHNDECVIHTHNYT